MVETKADHCKAGGRNYPIRPIARAIALQRNEFVTLLPLQGECIHVVIPQGVALAKSFRAFSPHSKRRNPAPIGARKSYSDPKDNKESVKR